MDLDSRAFSTSVFPLTFEHLPLIGQRIALEPLVEAHVPELLALFEPSIWQWYSVRMRSEDDLRAFIDSQRGEQVAQKTLAYAIRARTSGKVIGGTRFLAIDRENRRVEIGSTWYHPTWQRTFANTDVKLLMLTHAFETLKCISVQLQTDVLNVKSRRAIERLGAKLDGVLRFHRICHDGRIRNSAVYSISEIEWPDVRANLQTLARG